MTYVTAADGDWLAKDDPSDCLVARRRRERAAVRPVACHITLQNTLPSAACRTTPIINETRSSAVAERPRDALRLPV